MKELSLNILDIAKNSVRAGAKNIGIYINEDSNGILTLKITDDGCGMDEQTVKSVSNPFFTSRKTRKVGLGIPFLILAAEQTGGSVNIDSKTSGDDRGTTVTATFDKKSIDFTPLGNVIDSVVTLIQGDPDRDFVFEHNTPEKKVRLSTAELRGILGDVSLSEPEVLVWIKEYLEEAYKN